MVAYLDQNKWIELARMFHRKDVTARAQRILGRFETARNDARAVFPLSSVHYVETSRVSNVGRKVRLAEAMWHISRGVTLVAYSTIVRHELEVALSKYLPQVVPGTVSVLGKGHAHAFRAPPLSAVLAPFADEVERSLLTGNPKLGIQPPAFAGTTQRENFSRNACCLAENTGSVELTWCATWSPPGLEQFFREAGVPAGIAGAGPTPDHIAERARKYGMIFRDPA